MFRAYRGICHLILLMAFYHMWKDQDMKPGRAAVNTVTEITKHEGYIDHTNADLDFYNGMRDRDVTAINTIISKINKSLF
jgi:hypothetical protein